MLIFQLLLSIFSHFYLFPTIFTYSLSNLPFFDHHYLFSTVFTQIWVLLLIFLYHFLFFFIHFPLYLNENCSHLVMLSGRVRSGWPRVRPGQAKTSGLALDPMQARPGHEKSGPTLALPMDSVCMPPQRILPPKKSHLDMLNQLWNGSSNSGMWAICHGLLFSTNDFLFLSLCVKSEYSPTSLMWTRV